MRHFVTGLLLVLFVAVVPLAGASGDAQVGAAYDSFGYGGQLTITDAAGKPYRAWNEVGAVVSQGVVTSSNYVVSVPGASATLRVRVGDEILLVTDRNEMWE